MSKPWNKKKKKLGSAKANHGPCFHRDCKKTGRFKSTCVICENMVEAGTLEEPFEVEFCQGHFLLAEQKIKRHILLKHKGTIPAWMLAKLTGNA